MHFVVTAESSADVADQKAREAEQPSPSKIRRIVNALDRLAIAMAHTEIDE